MGGGGERELSEDSFGSEQSELLRIHFQASPQRPSWFQLPIECCATHAREVVVLTQPMGDVGLVWTQGPPANCQALTPLGLILSQLC